MRVKQEFRNERIVRMRQADKLIDKSVEPDKMDLYKLLKNTKREELSVEEIYTIITGALESSLIETLNILKSIYKDKLSNAPVEILNMLYSDDGKSLEDRIKHWLAATDNWEIVFTYLCRIIDTETWNIFVGVAKEKIKDGYVEIIGDPMDCEEVCSPWIGELYKISSMSDDMWPPYHPMCRCFPVFWAEDEVEED